MICQFINRPIPTVLEFCNPYSDGLPSSLSDDTGAAKINRTGSLRVAMLGSWPPLRGLSSYCFECALSLADVADVEFISFRKLYPRFLYPGGDLTEDPSFPECRHDRLTVRRRLTWYNPFTWLGKEFLHKPICCMPSGGVFHWRRFILPYARFSNSGKTDYLYGP